jgi:cytochrome c oxidase subunit 2
LESALVAVLFAGTGIGAVMYGMRAWAPPPLASRHGAGIDAMLDYLLLTTGALLLVGYVALGLLIWRGAARTRIEFRLPTPRVEVGLSVALGLLMALIAEGGVLAIGLPVWSEYFAATPPPDALRIEVTAQQFLWNVRYAGGDGVFGRVDPGLVDDASNPVGVDPADPAGRDDLVLVNQIYVPVGRPVRIRLRAKDVIHSFFLPNLRVKQDVVPGMSPEVVFVPTREGAFELACTELCGLGHYRMQGFFTVLSDTDYARRLEEEAAALGR